MHLFLKILVGVAVFFTPFSFAGAEPWAFSILQGIIACAWIGLLVSRREFAYPSIIKPVVYVFFVLIALALVQSCFPRTLLDVAVFYPVTFIRLYTLEHACLFMTYLSVVLLVIQVYPSFKDVRQLVTLLVICAIAVAICAWIFPNGEYIYRLTGVHQNSAAVGPFLNRNHGGVFLAMSTLLALGLFFTRQLRYVKTITKEQRRNFWVKQGWLLMILAGLITSVIFTRSRGAMLSLFVGLFSYAFLCLWSVPRPFKKRLKGIFYTLFLLAVSSTWIYIHIPDINEFSRRATGASEQTRKMMYHAAGNLLKKYPLWGIGIGAMPVAINEYTAYDVHAYVERLHNDWLEITLGVGIAGAVLLLLGLGWFGMRVLSRLKRLEVRKQFLFASLLSTLLAMCIGSTVDFHFFIPGCAFMFFVVLGLALAPTFHKGHVHLWHTGWIIRAVVLGLLLISMWLPLQKTLAWRAVLFGKGLKTEGKLEAYQRSLMYYPSPHYAVRLGNAYYNAGVRSKDVIEKIYYFEQARKTAKTYLEKYPKEKELSKLYIRVNRVLH